LNGSLTVPASYTEKTENWTAFVKPKDGFDFGNVSSTWIIIQNLPPQLSSVIVLPSNPSTAATLTTSYSYFDPDSDSEITEFREILWYRNGSLQGAFTNSTTIPPNMINKSETWYYEIRTYDGSNYSNWEVSSNVTIGNSIPTASALNITENPQTGDNLIASWSYSDADGDSENSNYIIRWYRYGVLVSSLNDTKTVESGNTSKGEIWYYTLQVYDGMNYSILYTLSPSFQILNTAPTASDLTLTTTPRTGDDLIAGWTFTDVDSDSESAGWIIRWYKNNVLQADYNDLKTVPSSATSKDEVWNYTVQVHDGTDYSIQYNSSTTSILNTAPTASDLTITSSPQTGDDLIASWTFADVDSDSESSSWIIRWFKNNGLESSYNDLKTVPSSATSKGQVWNYTVQVYDGTTYSIQYNSSTTSILNTAPTASALTISPGTPNTSSTLVADWQFNDADTGDSQVFYYLEWYRGITHQPAYDDIINIPSSATTKNQVWYFKVIVNDGETNSTTYTSPSVEIVNTAPTASDLTFTATPQTADDLLASWTFADVERYLI